jgi:hypothetical protein
MQSCMHCVSMRLGRAPESALELDPEDAQPAINKTASRIAARMISYREMTSLYNDSGSPRGDVVG